ncbi:hypothetical protein CfE428DRAFT_4193 [Chthoniobacter flavus Ellin428]|uniref:STAS/SEC14 domain-containing protein n=1 Tax=Chthoniobacter flavus Ellin428 TaxID=497964 RepID=B4D5K4_9BACT|nr:hypothetical protein [Chthoniobacter flavus]EDY18409.1 hypothetical protein CfE428DRAFT_4193 [Chthoniobacter flavus Ellin428]TCO90883.1 hypothetical protein EV701_10932 [Chthoniobacter flavus]
MHYSIGNEGLILLIQVQGGLSKPEILACWEAIKAHPEYPRATGALVLFDAVWWETSGDELGDLAKRADELRPIRWAFVTDEDLSYGMVRRFATQVEGADRFAVFRDEDIARKWLDRQ